MPKRFSKRKLQVVNTKTNRPIHPQPTSSKTYNPYAVLVPFTSVFLLELTVNTCRKKERLPTTLVAILNLRARSRGYASTNQTFFSSEVVRGAVTDSVNMGEAICILNLFTFFEHLEDHFHIPRENTDVQSLLRDCAKYNKENFSIGRRRTCFLRLISTPQGKVYVPFERNDLLRFVKETISLGNKLPNERGHIEATYRFNSCVGVYCTFRNGKDESEGIVTRELNSVMVVYDQERDDTIVGITAYPLYEDI